MREHAAIFERAFGSRLAAAHQLILGLPELFGSGLQSAELGYSVSGRELVALVRIEGADPIADEARFVFWTSRAGGRALAVHRLSEREQGDLRTRIARAELQRTDLSAARLADALESMAAIAGMTVPPPPLELPIDFGSPTGRPILEEGPGILFVPSPLAPPLGDEVRLRVTFPDDPSGTSLSARVSRVRPVRSSSPANPAGFALSLVSPSPVLLEAISRHFHGLSMSLTENRRAAPRYPVRSPVRLRCDPRVLPEVAPASSAPEPPQRLELRYESAADFSADFLENLSCGGAFVRTEQKLASGTAVVLGMSLPDGTELEAPGTVVHVGTTGVGVQFQVDPGVEAILSAALARIATRPRRAMVVGMGTALDGELSRAGFEVLHADDGAAAMRLLCEELFTIDALVVHPRFASPLVEQVRCAGGESDLAIVVAGEVDDPFGRRLREIGVDEVAAGPVAARAVQAAVDRRRSGRRPSLPASEIRAPR